MKKLMVVKVGIASYETQKARLLEIASGKRKPGRDEPKIWFASIESAAQVLSTGNQELLRLIARTQPQSIRALEEATGRRHSSLSRTLKTFARYGLVELRKVGRETVPRSRVPDDFRLSFDVVPPAHVVAAEDPLARGEVFQPGA
jgi:predicted transcriptional regulator